MSKQIDTLGAGTVLRQCKRVFLSDFARVSRWSMPFWRRIAALPVTATIVSFG
jgi:hypothetical protein